VNARSNTFPEPPGGRDAGRTPGRAERASLTAALAASGAATLTVQALLLRELMTAWRGNEMSFGIAMAVWLLTGGLGSASYGLVARRSEATRAGLARGLVALGLLAPTVLLVARAARGAMGLASGEITGFAPLALASLISLAPFTILAGFIFALSTALVHRESGSASAAGRVYLTEAAGAAAAGLAVSFLLLPRLDPVSIALVATAVTSGASAWLLLAATERRRTGTAAVAALVTIVSAGLAGPVAGRVDDATVGAQWRDLGFVAQRNSVYGRIVAVRTGSQRSVYESGVLAASVPDRRTAEETVHLPMLMHEAPARVLLLGGGMGGALGEALKHPGVEAVDYVELDPELIHTARDAFGEVMTEAFDDPRVSVHYADARFFVKRARGSYDVVIVGMPDPTTAQLNRFYTAEFMEEAGRALDDGGVLGLAVQSAENYIGTELAAYLACLKATAETTFEDVVLLPGDPCHVIASRSGEALTRDPVELSERVRGRGLDVAYVRDYYLLDRMSEGRTVLLDAALAEAPARVNSDLRPAAYYLSMVLWNRQFSGSPWLLTSAPGLLTERGALIASLVLAVLLAAPALAGRRGAPGPFVIVAAVFLVGATEMSLELTALLAFQSIYGYVYHQLALIVAAFMAGLALGGWLGTRAAAKGAGAGAFTALQLFIAAVPLALAAALARVAQLPPLALRAWAGLFPLIVVGAALLAGIQFPIAAKLVTRGRSDVGAVGGRLYGADLLGAAAGAIVTAVFLLPIMGTLGAMRALSLMNAAVLVSLVVALLRTKAGSR
jgi:spermidine synthase